MEPLTDADLSRLLVTHSVHPLPMYVPAHVRLEQSMRRLVANGLLTDPDLDADPDAMRELTPDGRELAEAMLSRAAEHMEFMAARSILVDRGDKINAIREPQGRARVARMLAAGRGE